MKSNVADLIHADAASGKWVPAPGDPLHECEFVRAGFRSWGLAAPPSAKEQWRLTLSRLDFGDSNPSALLEVHAEGHDSAFGDLGWFVFSHSIGTNGGTNFNQAIKRLKFRLGGSEEDWERRLTYLIQRARFANVSGGNGTYKLNDVPELETPTDYLFDKRIRLGRTMSLFGPGSAGKTTLIDGLIVSISCGVEILPGWLPIEQVPVLVLDWDEGDMEERVRLRAICRGHGVRLTEKAPYHYKRMTRPLHDVANEIGPYIAQEGIGVLIVSPMGRAQRQMGDNQTAPVDEVYGILREFGTTNVLIDHVTGENMHGKAQREFGSIRKRDNARGSYAVDVQSEEPGQRVLVLRNTKSDALAPRQADQAIRIEYFPQWPHEDGSYDTITFHHDEVVVEPETIEEVYTARSLREQIRDLLADEHFSVDELAELTRSNPGSVKTVLYRYRGTWFGQLPSSHRWELLPEGRNTLPSTDNTVTDDQNYGW